ncbi:MAG: protein kinase [Deltaproteobacteria bacterium]|nr:protein kinase [Deltaproteobacteria bacterium]
MGTVYRATDLETGRRVALKRMNERSDVSRFLREASLLAELSHPRVAAYVAHGVDESGALYLALEWLEGEDLASRLGRGRLDVARSLALGRAVASGLAALHAKGIVHRDVKPSNVFLEGGEETRAKILDLGIALGGGSARLTATGALIGTPSYMSPEQARGDPEIDPRTDVFALGCVLFEALTGVLAFGGDHPIAVLAKIVLDEPPRVRAARGDVPEAFETLVERMLAKDRSARPSDAGEVLRALESLDESVVEESGARSAVFGIGRSERRISSVVLVSGPDASGDEGTRARRELEISSDIAALGERSVALANGGLLVAIEGRGTPVELATQAARCARVVAARLPGVPVALATGRAELSADTPSRASRSETPSQNPRTSTFGDTVSSGAREAVPVGEVIDLAASLLAAGGPAGVRVDDRTMDLLGDRFEHSVVGSARLLGRERDGFDLEYSLGGRATPFVGRDTDLAVLDAWLDECIEEGSSRAALVVAPAGTGKSRLLREVLRRARGRPDLRACMARGDAMVLGSAFAVAGRLLQRRAGIADGMSSSLARERLREAFSSLPIDRRGPVAELLGEISGAPVPDVEASAALRVARGDAVVMSDAISSAWTEWLDAELLEGPVLLAIEDLHWGDLPSVRLLDAALRRLASRPLFVVATARPEVHERFPALWSQRSLKEVSIGALRKSASEKLARAVLGRDAPVDLVAAVVERAAGHPFLLEELLRALLAGRTLDELPDSVLAVVEARLYAFDPELRRVLRAASVLGESFWVGGVRALLGGTGALEDALQKLEHKEVIERRARSTVEGEVEYRFHHALLRDAAYGMLTDDDRRLAHRLAGEWLEGSSAREAARLAYHFDVGGAPARAAEWHKKAAAQALEGSDVSGAIDHAERAITGTEDDGARGELEALLAEALFWSTDVVRAGELAEKAALRLPPGSSSWFEALNVAIAAFGQRGHNDRVAEMLRRAGAAVAEPAALSAQVACLARAVSQLVYGERRAEARFGLARIRELAPELESLGPFVAGVVQRAIAELDGFVAGDQAAAIEGFAKAIRFFEQAGAHRNECLLRILGANILVRQGRDDEALSWALAGFAMAERLGVPFLIYLANEGLAELYGVTGDRERSMEHARRGLALKGGSVRIDGSCRRALAFAHLDLGELDEAEEHARSMLGSCPDGHSLWPYAASVFASVLLRRGRMQEAHALAEAGFRSMMELSMLVDFDWTGVLAVHAQALLAIGLTERAVAVAREGVERFVRGLPADPANRARILGHRMGPRELVELARELGVIDERLGA